MDLPKMSGEARERMKAAMKAHEKSVLGLLEAANLWESDPCAETAGELATAVKAWRKASDEWLASMGVKR
jgi:uncharacterized protein YhaN